MLTTDGDVVGRAVAIDGEDVSVVHGAIAGAFVGLTECLALHVVDTAVVVNPVVAANVKDDGHENVRWHSEREEEESAHSCCRVKRRR